MLIKVFLNCRLKLGHLCLNHLMQQVSLNAQKKEIVSAESRGAFISDVGSFSRIVEDSNVQNTSTLCGLPQRELQV